MVNKLKNSKIFKPKCKCDTTNKLCKSKEHKCVCNVVYRYYRYENPIPITCISTQHNICFCGIKGNAMCLIHLTIVPVHDEDVCPICIMPLNFYTTVKISKCQHRFHMKCIREWFMVKKVCPCCISPI